MKSNRIVFFSFLLGALCTGVLLQVVSCGGPAGGLSVPRGAWVSSGGELFKDANNPWFVNNTKTVSYCVKVDTSSFSTSPAEAEKLALKAIDYWKREFGRFTQYANTIEVHVATQELIRTDCDREPDLRFLFGYGTLSPSEAEYLSKSSNLVSVAVRTEYDTVNLKAKGFIYVSSDRGPFQYDSEDSLIAEAWKYPGLLYRTLLHETGHVFGIPHLSRGIMATQFVEYILKEANFQRYLQLEDPGAFFFPSEQGYTNCNISEDAAKVLGLAAPAKCFSFTIPFRQVTGQIEFLGSLDEHSPKINLGHAVVNEKIPVAMEVKTGVVLYLTPRQKVFANTNTKTQNYMIGPVFADFDFTVQFNRTDGTVIPLYLRLAPDGYEVWDLKNGRMHPLLYFSRNCMSVPPVHDKTSSDEMNWRICPNP